jgi:hypothetical protein
MCLKSYRLNVSGLAVVRFGNSPKDSSVPDSRGRLCFLLNDVPHSSLRALAKSFWDLSKLIRRQGVGNNN